MKNAVRAGFLTLIVFEAVASQGFLPVRPDYSWIGLGLTALLVWAVLEIIRIPGALSLVALGNVALDAVSDMFNFYSRIPNWDKFLHLLGGATGAAIAIYVILRAMKKGSIKFKNTLPAVVFAAMLIVSFAGMLYETQEMLIDIYKDQERQLGDGRDTVKDQLFNVFGAALAAELYVLVIISRESGARGRSAWAPRVKPNLELKVPREMIEDSNFGRVK